MNFLGNERVIERVLYDAGAPAECVRHGGELRRQKEEEEEEVQNEQERLAEGARKEKEGIWLERRLRQRLKVDGKREAKRLQKLVKLENRGNELLERRSKRENNSKEGKRAKDLRREARRIAQHLKKDEYRTLHKSAKTAANARKLPYTCCSSWRSLFQKLFITPLKLGGTKLGGPYNSHTHMKVLVGDRKRSRGTVRPNWPAMVHIILTQSTFEVDSLENIYKLKWEA